MKIRLLGTGAADGIPAFYSDSRVSRYAREHGGKDVRTRSGALIDGTLKIDLPPDTMAQLVRDKLDAIDWSAVVFTHSHDDHFAIEEIQYGLYPFNGRDFLGFTMYGNDAVCRKLAARYPDWPIEAIQTHSFEPFEHLGYRITPFKARHQPDEDSQNFVIEKAGRVLIYATDTGIWEQCSWDFLAAVQADCLVIECTEGFRPTDYEGHLSLQQCVAVVERLRKLGTLKAGARVVTTHHSDRGEGLYAELTEALVPHGIEVGFDGMEIEL